METKTETYWVAMYDTGEDADYHLFESEDDALEHARETLRAHYIAQWIADGGDIEVAVYRQTLPVNIWDNVDWSWWNGMNRANRVHVLMEVAPVISFPLTGSDGRGVSAVTIRKTKTVETERFTLVCDDCVANVWTEDYPRLSQALARLALLAHCAESDYALGFRSDPDVFAGVAHMFHLGQAG